MVEHPPLPGARRLAHILLLASLVAVALLAALSYHSLQTLVSLTDARKQVRESLLRLERTLSLLKDAETGQRGFLLTGEDDFLEPYRAARERLPAAFAGLVEAWQTEPAQAQRIRDLDRLIGERLALLAIAIDKRRQEGAEAAIAALKMREGKRKMDEIRALYADLEAAGRARIEELDKRVTAVRVRTAWLTVLLAAAILALVGLALLTLAREHRPRLTAETRAREAAAAEARAHEQAVAKADTERILESITDAFVALDRDWRITYVNATAAQLAAAPREALLGKHLWQDFPEIAAQGEFLAACERAMNSGQTVHRVGFLPAWQRWIESHIYPTPGGITVYFRDVTEDKRARDELSASRDALRRFAQNETERMEAERARIAREIHDQLGQIFTSIKLLIGQISARETAPQTASLLAEASGLVDAGVDVARRIAGELRPAILDDLGLSAALHAHAERFGRQSGICCVVEVRDDETLSPGQATQLYRIALEALTNVARHARARNVRITGQIENADYVLDITDDGIGWPPAGPAAESMGLTGMRERARLMGGSLELGNAPEGGARLRVRLPLATGNQDHADPHHR